MWRFVLFYAEDYGANNSFFFFQAEDGIRDLTVTGVQTCALPIWPGRQIIRSQLDNGYWPAIVLAGRHAVGVAEASGLHMFRGARNGRRRRAACRSEERRVGKSVDLGGRRIIKKKKNNK